MPKQTTDSSSNKASKFRNKEIKKDISKLSKPQPPGWVKTLSSFNDYVMTSIPPGPKFLQIRTAINLHKGLIFLFYYIIAKYYNLDWADNDRAILLYIIHSAYGIFWIWKDVHFPDTNWQKPATFGSFLLVFLALAPLYLTPMVFLASSQNPETTILPELEIFKARGWIFVSITFYIFGIFLHFTSDCQKYFQLKYQKPRSLITDGMFSYSRSPNYLGEVLIYSSFAMMSGHLMPLLSISLAWLGLFVPNIMTKDASISRYPEYASYKSKSNVIFIWMPSLIRDLGKAFLPI